MKAKIYYLVGTDHKRGWVKAPEAEAEIKELKELLLEVINPTLLNYTSADLEDSIKQALK